MLDGWTKEALEAFAALGIVPNTLPPFVRRSETNDELASPPSLSPELTEEEAELILPLLPPESRQAHSIPNRALVDALLWARQSGKRLTQLPSRFGTSESVRKRSERWAIAGIWDGLLTRLEGLPLSDRRRIQLRSLCIEQARRGMRIRKGRAAGL